MLIIKIGLIYGIVNCFFKDFALCSKYNDYFDGSKCYMF